MRSFSVIKGLCGTAVAPHSSACISSNSTKTCKCRYKQTKYFAVTDNKGRYLGEVTILPNSNGLGHTRVQDFFGGRTQGKIHPDV